MKKLSKAQLFKKILKEAVREVIQEEIGDIRDIIREELRNNKPLIKESKGVVRPTEISTRPKNPYEEFLPGIQQIRAKQAAIQNQIKQIQVNKPKTAIEELLLETENNMTVEDFQNTSNPGLVEQHITPNIPGNIDMGALSPEMAASIGEIEEWNPVSVNMPAQGMR